MVLVSGPSAEPDPPGVETLRVRTAEEMKKAVLSRLEDSTVVVMAAAVADYRPEVQETSKIKKGRGPLELKLVRTDDILLEVGRRRRPDQTIIGFAAETEDLEVRAKQKLQAKKLDLVVANDVSKEGAGFGTDTNEVLLVSAEGPTETLPLMSKREVSERVLDRIGVLRGRG